MNNDRKEVLQKLKRISASLAVAGTLISSTPSLVYSSEIGVNKSNMLYNVVKTDLDNKKSKNEKETVGDNSISFEGVYDNLEEAQKVEKQKKKEYDNLGYNNIISEIIKEVLEKESTFEKTSSSKEALMNALDEYVKSTGAKISSSNIKENTTSSEKVVEEKTETIDTTVDEFVSNLNQKVEKLNENGEYRIEFSEPKTVKVEEEVVEVVDTKEVSEKFGTKEEANEYIKKMNSENSELKIVKNYLNVIQELDGVVNQKIEETYDSLEEAKKRLDELKTKNKLNDSNIEKIVSGNGSITSAQKFASNSSYSLGINDFFIIKQGSGTIAIWTKQDLSNQEKNALINNYFEYNKQNSVDGSTLKDKVNRIEFISGLGTFSLKRLGNNWGEYTFKQQGNSIIMTCDASRISHGIVGSVDKKISYRLTADYDQEKCKDVYEVVTNIIIKEMKVKEVEKTEMSYKIIQKIYDTTYKLTAQVKVPVEQFIVKVNGDKIIDKQETPLVPDDSKPDVSNNNDSMNKKSHKDNSYSYKDVPETGDNAPISSMVTIAIGTATMAIISSKGLIKKRKRIKK